MGQGRYSFRISKKNQFRVTNLQNTFKNFKINFIKRNAKYSLNGLYIDGNQRLRKSIDIQVTFLKPKEFNLKEKSIQLLQILKVILNISTVIGRYRFQKAQDLKKKDISQKKLGEIPVLFFSL